MSYLIIHCQVNDVVFILRSVCSVCYCLTFNVFCSNMAVTVLHTAVTIMRFADKSKAVLTNVMKAYMLSGSVTVRKGTGFIRLRFIGLLCAIQ